MDYIFGERGNRKILKTKGSTHSNLTGYQQKTQEYPDQTIRHYFRIVRKIASKDDTAGNCYDWYVIDKYYRDTDKSKPVAEKVEENADFIENALCEMDAAFEEWRGLIEDALCELEGGI